VAAKWNAKPESAIASETAAWSSTSLRVASAVPSCLGADGENRGTLMPAAARKYRYEILPISVLLLLGSLAFVHLLALPVFEDEGSQLRWVWRIIDAGEWLQPLGDGKPLEAWPLVPLVRLGVHPLTAARALHVLAGMIGAVLIYQLAHQMGDRWTAFVTGVLYTLCPFVVYLQRLALSDIFMCVAGMWVLLSIIKFVRCPDGRHAVLLATSLMLTAFCKFPVGFFFLIAMPLALLLMPLHDRRELQRPPALRNLIGAHAPAALLAVAVFVAAFIRLRGGRSPGFGLQDLLGIGGGRYHDVAATIGIARPNLANELSAQLSWPVTVAGLVGLVAAALLDDWRKRWLITVGLLPMLGIGLLAQFWFPRYLLFTIPPLIVAAVSGWRSLSLRAGRFRLPLQFGVLALCAGFMGRQSALLIIDPVAATWSPVDRFQYFEGWGSGYGYPEAAKFALQAANPPLMIYSLDGHSAYQLLTYLPVSWTSRVKPIFYGQDGKELPSAGARLENLLVQAPTWILISEELLQVYLDSTFDSSHSDQFDLSRIAVFEKPGSRSRLAIYDVRKSPDAGDKAHADLLKRRR
jgi:dolichyl-phosphate-mannose-protein mannosyltransferase